MPPLRIGPLTVDPPVVLAPMAGVTNAPFRRLCRRFGAGLYVSEMITARALVEGNAKTARMVTFAPDERPAQPPALRHRSGRRRRGGRAGWSSEGRVDHIDLNFGCPVPKVTRQGGGAAMPVKRQLLRGDRAGRVRAAAPDGRAGHDEVPHGHRRRRASTFLDAGRIGEDEGVAAVALHARTAAQLYSGEADWDAIAELKAAVHAIPVLGNGDIWEAADALRMMRATGCDGVVVGRGCLGRPWLFGDLADVFAGRTPRAAAPPRRGGRRHGRARPAARRAGSARTARCATSASTPAGTSPAIRSVPDDPPAAGAGRRSLGRARRPAGQLEPDDDAAPRRPAHPAGPHQRAPPGRTCPTAGSTTPTTSRRCRPRPTPSSRGG